MCVLTLGSVLVATAAVTPQQGQPKKDGTAVPVGTPPRPTGPYSYYPQLNTLPYGPAIQGMSGYAPYAPSGPMLPGYGGYAPSGAGGYAPSSGPVFGMQAEPGGPVEIAILDNYFYPAVASVARGSKVRWTNYGTHTHSVADYAGSWKSGDLAKGESYTLTVTRPLNYYYYCRHHRIDMRGTLVVK
jgi:plastocyanin